LQPITLKFEDFEILVWFIFSSNWPNEHVVAERERSFSYNFLLKSIALFYALFIALLKGIVIKIVKDFYTTSNDYNSFFKSFFF